MAKQENNKGSRKAHPIDLDTCETWDSQAEEDLPTIVTATNNNNNNKKKKKPSTKPSHPFASTLKLLIKTTTSKRLSLTKKHGSSRSASSSLNGDTSMSSGPSSTSYDQDDEAENETPTFFYKTHIKSPLLKNTDNSLYDSRPISTMANDSANNRPASKLFRQYQPMMDAVVAL